MKKIVECFYPWDEEDIDFLAKYGIIIKLGSGRIRFDYDERYPEIRSYFKNKYHSSGVIAYEYSKEEFDNSEYYILNGIYGCGFPQPEKDYKYKSLCFDINKICPVCGCGREQINDLRISKVAKHGIFGYSAWLSDELFVHKEVYEEIFAPLGVNKRSVIKGGKILEDVFQLVIPVIDESIYLADREFEICPLCGEVKYSMQHYAYPFFPLHKNPLPGIYKTKEYFGAGQGRQAQRIIFISKDVADKLLKRKDIKDYFLIPCRRADSNQ